MANGMTTGTIGTTAEKDKTRSGVLLVRIQYLETCKKKQKKQKTTTTTKQNETQMHFSTPQYCMQKINTILHTDKYYTGTESLHDIRALTYASRQVRRQQYIWW